MNGKIAAVIVGILILGAFAMVGVGLQGQTITSLDRSVVWTGEFSSGKCGISSFGTIDEYKFSSEDDNILDDNWLVYKCGFGRLYKDIGQASAYTNQCTLGMEKNAGKLTAVSSTHYVCRSDYTNLDERPDKSSKCEKRGVTGPGSNFDASLITTDDIANSNGVVDTANKFDTIAVKINDGLFKETSGRLIISANRYQLDIIEGNGFRANQVSGCSLNEISSLDKVLPSTLDAEATNTFSGEQHLAFGRVINWIWAYSPTLSELSFQHPDFGYIYVDRANSYIPIENIDGLDIALESNRKSSSLIECVPNRINCDKGTLIEDDTQLSCSDFKGFSSGEAVLLASGNRCKYSCVDGQPKFDNCIKVDECGTGKAYDEKSNTCIEITQVNPPVIVDPEQGDYTVIFIIIGIVLIVLIMVVIKTKMNRRR